MIFFLFSTFSHFRLRNIAFIDYCLFVCLLTDIVVLRGVVLLVQHVLVLQVLLKLLLQVELRLGGPRHAAPQAAAHAAQHVDAALGEHARGARGRRGRRGARYGRFSLILFT